MALNSDKFSKPLILGVAVLYSVAVPALDYEHWTSRVKHLVQGSAILVLNCNILTC